MFTNNTTGVVNAIGELSANAQTFSKNIGSYTTSTPSDVTFLSYLNQVDGADQLLGASLQDQVMRLVTWVYQNTITASVQIFSDELLNKLLTQFQTEANTFQCGNIVTDGKYYIPEWISWVKIDDQSVVKVWFSDPSFQTQYDEFSITVIPPLDNLDDFFMRGNVVEQKITARAFADTIALIQAARANYPETILWSGSYNYTDPVQVGHIVPTNWTVLIYGPAGNNIDSIKDALINFILNNSSHQRTEWTPLLPDIFKRTEVIAAPFWQKYAIPFRSTTTGIYSPFANGTEVGDYLQANAPGYARAHIDLYSQHLSYNYRSISIATIGSAENRDNLFRIQDIYPDYIAVNTGSLDFNRMSAKTQNWAEKFQDLIMLAETAGQYSSTPPGITKVTRNGLLYVVNSIDNIHWLVLCKSNFPS